MELVYGPVTVLLFVHRLAGVTEVLLQQTPSAVIADPPLDVTLPPPAAVVDVTFDVAVVMTVGDATDVENVTELP